MADNRAERIADLIKPLRVKPGSKVNLTKDFDPGYKAGVVKKKDGEKAKAEAREKAKAKARANQAAGNGQSWWRRSGSRTRGVPQAVSPGGREPWSYSEPGPDAGMRRPPLK